MKLRDSSLIISTIPWQDSWVAKSMQEMSMLRSDMSILRSDKTQPLCLMSLSIKGSGVQMESLIGSCSDNIL